MKKETSLNIIGCALMGLCAGCISSDRTDYREEARLNVAFENDAAGRLFYETLSKNRGHYGRRDSTTHVYLPIVFSHKHRVMEGESVAFNEAVRRCDTNGDGTITELEARIFSEHDGED